jgi:hypothetical protein
VDILNRTLNWELLGYAVSRVIVCPLTRDVLDVRTAVLVDATDHGGAMAVVTGDAWDTHKDVVVQAVLGEAGTDFTVIDGRQLSPPC